ncbi:hypothetical protein [Marinomonas sp. 2405UD68-3]|uniref:hypothetical protein n=1 Tax=Marinomonas sp. 2405UD68-3 TaxID=3391835 RepID=UPI0039C9C735
MYLEKESLEIRFKRRIGVFLFLVFAVLSVIYTMMKYSEAEQMVLSQLENKHNLVERAFSSYLQKAEFELSSISQLFSNAQLEEGREMNSLFSNHDDFLLGAVDFLYVKRDDGRSIIDPRSSLYLDDSAALYSVFSKIGQWLIFATDESSYFLVFKKNMVANEGESIGYIYGFISLNNNFVLAQSLLTNVNIDGVMLSTAEGVTVFDGKGDDFTSEELMSSYDKNLDLSGSFSTLQLKVFLKKADFFLFEEVLVYQILLLAFGLLGGYFMIMFLSQKAVFNVMSDAISDLSITKKTKYREFDEIEKIIHGKNASEEEQARALQILMEGASIAIIFCDEVASVLRMNQEAKQLYSDAEGARTLFDFMPIISHSPIQQALKGEAGTSFTLSFSQVNKIFHWKLYPYIAESGFRGLVLIGNDITKETQLEWQLTQTQPSSLLGSQQISNEKLQSELLFLAARCDRSTDFPISEWLNSLAFGLQGVGNHESSEEKVSTLGRLLCDELTRMPVELQSHDNFFIDCGLDVACISYPWPRELKSLLSSILMMIHSNELVEEKALCFKLEEQKLIIQAVGVSHSRAIFLQLVECLVEKMGAKLNISNGRRFSIALPYAVTGCSAIELPVDSQVIWIENGYEQSELVKSTLNDLNVELVCISSAEDIFLHSMQLERIDAILVGCSHQYDEDYNELLETMSMMLGRSDLPIARISCNSKGCYESLRLEHYPFSYSIAELLISLFQLRPISPDDMLPEGRNWLLTGGTKVSKAIMRNELIEHDIVPHFIDDIDSYLPLLNHYRIEVIIVLDQISPKVLMKIQLEFPQVMVLLTQKESHNNDAKYFVIRPPYDTIRIKDMVTFVNKSTVIDRIEEK